MARPPVVTIALALLAGAGCGHGSAQLARGEWCDKVESFKENDHWACTWPPSRYSPGDFGPRSNLSRYNVVGAVFEGNDPALQSKAEVRRIGTLDLALTRDATVQAGVGLGLRSLSPWLPDATLDVNRSTKVSVSFRLEDAEWRLYHNLAPTIASELVAKTGDAVRQAAIERGRGAICQGGTSIVEGVLVGRISATIKASSATGSDTTIGWKNVGARVKTTDDRTTGLTVKSGDEQVAVLYLVNPADDVLKSFKVCEMASRAPLAECGEGGGVCCENNHCLHDLICQQGRCMPSPSLCGNEGQVCCGGGSCAEELTCHQGQCIGRGQHFGKGMALFALYKYDDAIKEFEAGFLEQPDPSYLYNIALAHKMAERREQAAQYFRRYLEVAPGAKNRAEVEDQLARLTAPGKRAPRPVLKSAIPDELEAPELNGGANKPSPGGK